MKPKTPQDQLLKLETSKQAVTVDEAPTALQIRSGVRAGSRSHYHQMMANN